MSQSGHRQWAERTRAMRRKLASYGALVVEGYGLTQDRPLRGPLYAQISICDPCNHRCVMCPYHPPGQPSTNTHEAFAGARPGLMDVATFRTLVDELYELGTLQIDLVGRGEPLLHPSCAEMVKYAAERGLEVVLTTNGSRLDAACAEALLSAGLHRLKLSLNAGRSDTYPRIHVTESPEAHRAVVANVRRLTAMRGARRRSPHVTLSFTIIRANAHELDAMLDRVVEAGADAAWFQHVIDDPARPGLALDDAELKELVEETIPRALEHARSLGIEHNLDAFAKTPPPGRADDGFDDVVPCYIGSFFTSVLGNGNVVPCCQINRSVGSIGANGFKAVWQSDSYRDFRHAARHLPAPSPALETAECHACYFRPHNRTIHSTLHPLESVKGNAAALIPLRHLLRMTRTEQPGAK